MLRHLVRLHEEASEFMDHLVPAEGGMEEDSHRVELLHTPDSDFFADYDDFDRHLRTRLSHYRGDGQQYIHIRAAHAALFPGTNQDTATRTGLDLLLYLANLTVFAKDMMPLGENDKTTVGALRDLDNYFPHLFLPALVHEMDATESVAGDSALLQETFELALELRTQLAISSLTHGVTDETFDPDAALDEVFCHPPSESGTQLGVFRGWTTSALGGDGSPLPDAFVQKVVDRMEEMRVFFSTGETSQGHEEEESVNLDGLSAAFPWIALVLRLVGWVRARNSELLAAIQHQGGASKILERVQREREQCLAVAATGRSISRSSPRKSRSSFGRNRRRSSRYFDPNAEVDAEVLSKLIAREGAPPRDQDALAASAATLQFSQEEEVEQVVVADGEGVELLQHQDVEPQLYQAEEDNDATNVVDEAPGNVAPDMIMAKPMEELPNHRPPVQELGRPDSSRPPQSTNDFVNLLRETRASEKENRVTFSIFERQANAERVHFGTGFDDSQPTPGPSRSQPTAGASRKGKEPQHLSPRKRKIREVFTDDDDDDAFETAHRSGNVQRQRANAPKRVRIEPRSSGAPTSHQPRSRDVDDGFRPIEDFPRPEQEEPSEADAPEMTEEAPPRSTMDDIKALARANTSNRPRQRRAKKPWSTAEEEALMSYMSECPHQYSRILKIDKDSPQRYFHALENGEWVAQRTQVDLKDKARVMAKNMVK